MLTLDVQSQGEFVHPVSGHPRLRGTIIAPETQPAATRDEPPYWMTDPIRMYGEVKANLTQFFKVIDQVMKELNALPPAEELTVDTIGIEAERASALWMRAYQARTALNDAGATSGIVSPYGHSGNTGTHLDGIVDHINNRNRIYLDRKERLEKQAAEAAEQKRIRQANAERFAAHESGLQAAREAAAKGIVTPGYSYLIPGAE